MRKIALLGASALVLTLGVGAATAQPSGQQILTRGQTSVVKTHAPNASRAIVSEGRAAFAQGAAVSTSTQGGLTAAQIATITSSMGATHSSRLVQSPASCAPDWADPVWAPGEGAPIGFSCYAPLQ